MRAALALLAFAAVGCQRTDATSAGADCARVADTLATFELGPAATPDARAPVVAKHRTACESTKVTAAEATCLGRATDTWAARACLPRMFPPPPGGGTGNVAATGCATVVDRMRVAVMQEVGSEGSAAEAVLDRMLPIIQSACEQDRWPAAVVDCIARTKPGDMSAFQACANQLPKELQDKLGQKLLAAQEQPAQPPAAPSPPAQ